MLGELVLLFIKGVCSNSAKRNLTLTLNIYTERSYRSIQILIKILRIMKSKQPFREKKLSV